ncbi:MAG: hypothetical protein ACQEW7_06455 [Pseudomonadota bacterium]
MKDYLDWTKVLVSICSAGVATLLVKFDGSNDVGFLVKAAAVLFFISLAALLFAYVALVEHKNSETENVSKRGTVSLGAGWFTFFLAFLALVINLSFSNQ